MQMVHWFMLHRWKKKPLNPLGDYFLPHCCQEFMLTLHQFLRKGKNAHNMSCTAINQKIPMGFPKLHLSSLRTLQFSFMESVTNSILGENLKNHLPITKQTASPSGSAQL